MHIETKLHDVDSLAFYGHSTMSRVRTQEAIDSAVRKFRMAINASSESVQERALVLAAKEELRAFA